MERIRTGVLIALALFAACIVGCGGGTKTVKIEQNVEKGMALSVPEAYTMNYASDTSAIYGKGTALSKDMQIAVDLANLTAETEVATLMESKIERYSTYLVRQEGDPKQLETSYKDATKRVVSQTLQGKEEHFRTINREGSDYRAYVILKVPVGKANKALLDQIKKNEELWRMYKDDKQLKELEENVRRYEESIKNP
jgi:hypothetical protein